MILFLNFTPIEFMGGTEKWMNNTAKKVSIYENTQMISMHPKIANIYGTFVLKRKYDKRIKKTLIHNHISLEFKSFIPLSREWKETRKIFSKSRIIYTRYEVLEFLIVIYFLGESGLKKTIAGIHSPFIYQDQISFFDKLHNALYSSIIYKKIFQKIKKIHVLNRKDQVYISQLFSLQNVIWVPNGADTPELKTGKITDNIKQLKILFVGELSLRKGVDVLIKIMQQAPVNISFTIAGDGPLKQDIIAITKKSKQVTYQGYADKNKLDKLYRQNEVLILPSRAESMSLALLEAMSYGLIIIDSTDTALDLDRKVEYACSNKNITTYINTVKKLFNLKMANKLNQSYVRNYFKNNFSSSRIDIKLAKNIFEINNL